VIDYPLSLRNVEDLLVERGIAISHETVRFWWNWFGPISAAEIRKRQIVQMRAYPQLRWHLDEVIVKVNGKLFYLWRAVDHEGEVLNAVVTSKRDKAAALKLPKRILKKYGRPRKIVTDGLCSYSAAIEVGAADRQKVGRRLYNRAERIRTNRFGFGYRSGQAIADWDVAPTNNADGRHESLEDWRGRKTDFVLLRTVSSALYSLATQPVAPRVDNVIEIVRLSLARDYIAELKRLSTALVRALDEVLLALKVSVPEAFQVQGRDQIPLRDLAAKARVWRDTQSRFDEWRRLASADSRVRSLSAVAFADALAAGGLSPTASEAVLECTFAETVWSKAVAEQPELTNFYGPAHGAVVDQFRELETWRRRTTVEIVRGRHAERMPRGNFGAMNTIRSEIARRRGRMAIRKLFKTTGETLQRIKPVLLMSPISVAQFLPPDSIEFDLLVIDEASQVRPEDALGLVLRTKQMVVVGDNKQLPPTSFFDRIVADEEEADPDETIDTVLEAAAKATDLESILALSEARGLNSCMLRWHYRSRHPSLIEVSNAEFYKQLIMPPAPKTDRTSEGLLLRRIAGAYDRGGKRTNLIEAEAVVNAVVSHARSGAGLSLGVVTFSTAQRDAIEDLLEIKRRSDATLDELLREGKGEDVFVKKSRKRAGRRA
jgi:transposase-like protein